MWQTRKHEVKTLLEPTSVHPLYIWEFWGLIKGFLFWFTSSFVMIGVDIHLCEQWIVDSVLPLHQQKGFVRRKNRKSRKLYCSEFQMWTLPVREWSKSSWTQSLELECQTLLMVSSWTWPLWHSIPLLLFLQRASTRDLFDHFSCDPVFQ